MAVCSDVRHGARGIALKQISSIKALGFETFTPQMGSGTILGRKVAGITGPEVSKN